MTPPEEPVLVAHALCTPMLPTLPAISLSIQPSTILVVRGPSGIGKSVLLKLVSLLLCPAKESSVLLHGFPVQHYGMPAWRSRVLYIPQRPALLPNSPREFWQTVASYSTKKREDLGDPMQIAKEWGIDASLWERNWGSLSGGEGQRIALSIGIALRPDVLLLDEPTSALDHNTTLLVEATLLRRDPLTGKRQTIICVTHEDEQERRIADAVLVLRRAENGHPGGGEVVPVRGEQAV